MGILQHHHRWSTDQEILPEFPPESDSSSSENSLASVSSLTTSKQPSTTQKHHYLTTFKAHTSSITSLTLAGKHLLSGSSDNQVRVWPRDALPTVQNLMAYGESTVKSMVVCGDKLFTGHQDHKIRVWKIEHDDDEVNKRKMVTSTYLATLPTINDRVTKMFLAKNYIKIPRNKKCTWVNHIDAVAALALSHDSSLLYSASWDRTFKVWRTSDFKCLESVSDAHDDAINAIVVSHDGYIYTGSADRKIKVWRKHPGEKKHTLIDTLEKHKSAVNALALSPDGSVLYSGACDRSILVWEKGNGRESGDDWRHMVVAGALRGHGMAVLCIVVVRDEQNGPGTGTEPVPNRYRYRIYRTGYLFGTDSVPTFDIFGTGSVPVRYGTGSDRYFARFYPQIPVPNRYRYRTVPNRVYSVPVPVPTFEDFRYRFFRYRYRFGTEPDRAHP